MQTKTIETYSFDELSEKAQQRAIEDNWLINVDYDWWEWSEMTIETAANLLGIERCKLEGFSLDRGSYIALSGFYSYRKGAEAAIRAEFGGEWGEELAAIAAELRKAQRPLFYQACATLKPHYYRGEGTSITVEGYGDLWNYDYIENVADQTIAGPLADFCEWALDLLRKEEEYLTSEEAIAETLRINDYQFLENGGSKYYV